MLMLFISVGLLGWLSYTKKVWSRFVYSKRGSDKTREKINETIPTPVSIAECRPENQIQMTVLSFILSLIETVRFLLKDKVKHTFIKYVCLGTLGPETSQNYEIVF